MAVDTEEIKKQLRKLPEGASVALAYRCALRALPLLADTGNFAYWGKDQDKHLFAVFHVLDGLEGIFQGIPFSADADDDDDAAYASAANAAYAADATYATYAAYAAYASAANAAYAVYVAAASAADDAAYAFRRSQKHNLVYPFEQMVASDLKWLKKNVARELLDEPLWQSVPRDWPDIVFRFETALSNVGLDFWIPIFHRRFNSEKTNLKALKRRLDLPDEIEEQGHRAVIRYLEATEEEEVEKLKEVKVVFLGDGGAGKTSLIHRIMTPEENLPEDSPPTPGVDIHLWALESEEIQAHLWDFGGQVIMHATHQFFMSKRSVYVIVLDGRREQNPDYWLHHSQTFGGDSPVLVVMNKVDQHQEDLERNTLLKRYPNIQGFFPMSCKDNRGVATFVEQLQQALKTSDSWNTALPSSWYAIKKQLQKRPEPYIDLKVYHEICSQQKVEQAETCEVLLRHLNDLGVVVHFEELDYLNTYVLNPGWLTNAVYRVINSDALKVNSGIIALEDLQTLFCHGLEAAQVPQDKHHFIMKTMEKFELAFSLKHEMPQSTQRYLIPDLLNPDEPEDLDFSTKGAMIRFRFRFPFLPTSVMARFIVRTAEDIDGNLRWRSGVVLKNTSLKSRALIKADNDQRKIEIWVQGERQRDHFALISDHFHKIFRSYANFNYQEEVPLSEDGKVAESYKHLLGLEEMGEEQYLSGALRQRFDLKALLNGIESETRRQASETRRPMFQDPKTIFQKGELVKADPEQIFISYSHPDKAWLDRLLVHLDALEHEGIRYWYDKKIQAGDLWNDEIEQAVDHCEVAIFLISRASLKSKFIREKEVPVLQKRGVKIIPILVDTCGWSVVKWLKQLQFANGTTPLDELSDSDCEKAFVEVLTRVNGYLNP